MYVLHVFVCVSEGPGVPHAHAESGGVVLAAGPRVPRGGVTRQGVALTELQSLVDCQKTSLSPKGEREIY